MKTGIVIADIHYPYHNHKALNILFNICRDIDPDYLINLGDALDFDCISTYANAKPRRIENKTLQNDYEGYQKDVLDPLEDILKPECKKVYIFGNHENRINNYMDYYPVTRGIIEPQNNLDLSDWEIVPYKQHFKLGNTVYTHGMWHNQHHAKKHLDAYGCNIIYGHLHTHQIYCRQTPVDSDPVEAMSLGCLCDLNPHYNRDAPNKWINQILVFYLEGRKQFNQVLTIKGKSNPRTVFNGKMYG